ncbi:uncharacterized protein BJ171DRAFT_187251 [Polychytrium aggregatum]|uniref:uncharacterized protein n=1 Tax=Polychytrium aggregatum TaxID=110093 RepID=UPI0022FEDD18|nr:uncharacterized protein BJ171DRAFT_187251 [Polychytrium aggregatum]KAI9202193.1 hypothetical protein BJ171DRAFT_187251 [Polychytrium aggregatum]
MNQQSELPQPPVAKHHVDAGDKADSKFFDTASLASSISSNVSSALSSLKDLSSSFTQVDLTASMAAPSNADHVAAHVKAQLYGEKKAKLSSLLQETRLLLEEVRPSTSPYVVRYPTASLPARTETSRRSSMIVDSGSPSLSTSPQRAPTPTMSASVSHSRVLVPKDPLRVLQLDLKNYSYNPDSLSTADITLISQLLDVKFKESLAHLEKLHNRITDTRSKVLVTGDLNAGKSTFVNAVLRREVVPDDQQPCTALFCEVVDAEQNDGIEEVHGIHDPEGYNRLDSTTFTRLDIRHLRDTVEENEENFELLKVYCRDNRHKDHTLLHNGIVDISLIDSPGLNIDTTKTTALFAQQEEIDVVVFVVNAENHFTLSGREFLQTAGKEKAYIFIVVNKFDTIRRAERCRSEILEQIRQISPNTFSDASSLVHFVSARQTLQHDLEKQKALEDAASGKVHEPIVAEPAKYKNTSLDDFVRLEECLRSFILDKRARSKLAPAKIYLHNLLADVRKISAFNNDQAEETFNSLAHEMDVNLPSYEMMKGIKEKYFDDVDKVIEDAGSQVEAYCEKQLSGLAEDLESYTDELEWNGIVYMWQYARDLRNMIYKLATHRIKKAEEFASKSALSCIQEIQKLAAECMDQPPKIDLGVVTSAFDGELNDDKIKTLPLELDDFFDLRDKLDIAQSYVPGVGMALGGLIGYKAGLKLAGNPSLAKLLFAGLGVAGVGLIAYSLSDVKATVQNQVRTKMVEHLERTRFAETNKTRIAKTFRRVLRLAMYQFQNQFLKDLEERTQKLSQQRQRKETANETVSFFHSVIKHVKRIEEALDQIDLEDKL